MDNEKIKEGEGLVITQANADILMTSSLVSQFQDIMMEVVKKHPKFKPTISIFEQTTTEGDVSVKIVATEYDWEKKEWKKNTTSRLMPLQVKASKNEISYYWTLEVAGVTIMSSLRYKTFEAAAETALYWEDPWRDGEPSEK